MQLLKSLFCLRGFDNRTRFIAINFSCLVSFIILNEIFVTSMLMATLSLLFCLSVCVIATQRRLNDAQLHRNWILAPTGSFLLSGLTIIFIGHGGIYWLLIIPLLLSLLLLTYPSIKNRNYILGYHGPIDLSEYLQSANSNIRTNLRIEPTMHRDHSAESVEYSRQSHSAAISTNDTPTSTHANVSDTTRHEQTSDIGESIRLMLFSNRNAQITVSTIAFLLILAMVISLIFGGTSEIIDAEHTLVTEPVANEVELQHHITLPDNFSLMVSPYNGLIISWQADNAENKALWNIADVQGDDSCQSIIFNKGEAIRSLTVMVENSNQYSAHFSPLDTKALVKNIAFKGSFSLCGYDFSLKGSQAVLGKTEFYANLIEY